MSKKFNVSDIVKQRKNELDYSPLFESKPSKSTTTTSHPVSPQGQDNAGMPANQQARNTEFRQDSIPESQHSGILEIRHNVTATEKATFRFHNQGKYAIEDIKTILTRKMGIKTSLESIAEEAILIAYDDLLENQHASKLAKRLSRKPEIKKAS